MPRITGPEVSAVLDWLAADQTAVKPRCSRRAAVGAHQAVARRLRGEQSQRGTTKLSSGASQRGAHPPPNQVASGPPLDPWSREWLDRDSPRSK